MSTDLSKNEAVGDEDLKYSNEQTKLHIHRVQQLMLEVIGDMAGRAAHHDRSKLLSPEAEGFARYTKLLKGMTYGSPEYKQCLADMKPFLDHHYANNSHHPEHYPEGVHGMTLMDLMEMLVDWKAAGERHADGSIGKSLNVNQVRFAIGGQLQDILCNTARSLGWM